MAKRKITFQKMLNHSDGFTLMEVMIAMVIFAVFTTAFVTGQGYNLLDSSKLKEDMLLKDFCENKINDIIINPPELRDSLTLTKETKDVDANKEYQTIVEFKKIFIPDMSKLMGDADKDKDKNQEEESAKAQMEKRIFKVFKDNMEKMIWQVEVTVKNKNTDATFKLSTWIYNQNADVQIGAM
jgi:prepilin-type N-terminal cleavage/methylation domain-containing protein